MNQRNKLNQVKYGKKNWIRLVPTIILARFFVLS